MPQSFKGTSISTNVGIASNPWTTAVYTAAEVTGGLPTITSFVNLPTKIWNLSTSKSSELSPAKQNETQKFHNGVEAGSVFETSNPFTGSINVQIKSAGTAEYMFDEGLQILLNASGKANELVYVTQEIWTGVVTPAGRFRYHYKGGTALVSRSGGQDANMVALDYTFTLTGSGDMIEGFYDYT